jgi:hypothetical protein
MPPATLSPEARLILLTAGGARNDAAIRRLLEKGGLDWTRLIMIAESEKASWPLWKRVSRVGPELVPDSAAAHLQRLAMVAEFRLRMLEQRLGEALEVLTRANIDVMLFKGAALAPLVYGNFVLRPMGDLDLMIELSRAEEARQVLVDAGWFWTRDPQLDEFYKDHHHLPPLIDSRGTGAVIELHTALFFTGNPFRFDPDTLRRRARTVRVQRWSVQVPDSLHLLLHACLHFAWSHLLSKGAWRTFRDVDVLVEAEKIDWPAFIALAKEARGTSSAYWTFRMAKVLSGITIPDEVMAALRPPISEFLARRLEQHYAFEVFAAESRCPSEPLRSIMWELGMQPRWSGHGSIRPWQRDENFQPTVPRMSAAEALNVAPQGRDWRAVARYMFSVMRPRPIAE